MKNKLILADGTEISSGSGAFNSITNLEVVESVNNGTELTLGSVCAATLKATILAPGGNLEIPADSEIQLYRDGVQAGVFIVEKPQRASAHSIKLTGYDRVVKLDKDLSSWLKSLTGFPYSLSAFAAMVAEQCGCTMNTEGMINGDHPVYQFTMDSVTGRKLVGWCAELAGSYCRCQSDGTLVFERFTDSGETVTPTGDSYYFRNGLKYEDYNVQAVDGIQASIGGVLYPEIDSSLNIYALSANPLLGVADEFTSQRLEIIKAQIPLGYRPGKVKLPYSDKIRAGQKYSVTTPYGTTFDTLVMTRTIKGGTMTLECTGSARRNSPTAVNNKPASQPSGTGSTGGYYPIVEGAPILEPRKFYVFGEVDSLVLSLKDMGSGYAYEYCFEFTAGENFRYLAVTPDPKWATSNQVVPGRVHQVSILHGIGVMVYA